MRLYVECKAHPGERHYVDMRGAERRRDCLSAFAFPGVCGETYYREDLHAEPGPALSWNLMFEPFVMMWWSLSGRLAKDRAAVEAFDSPKEG